MTEQQTAIYGYLVLIYISQMLGICSPELSEECFGGNYQREGTFLLWARCTRGSRPLHPRPVPPTTGYFSRTLWPDPPSNDRYCRRTTRTTTFPRRTMTRWRRRSRRCEEGGTSRESWSRAARSWGTDAGSRTWRGCRPCSSSRPRKRKETTPAASASQQWEKVPGLTVTWVSEFDGVAGPWCIQSSFWLLPVALSPRGESIASNHVGYLN